MKKRLGAKCGTMGERSMLRDANEEFNIYKQYILMIFVYIFKKVTIFLLCFGYIISLVYLLLLDVIL